MRSERIEETTEANRRAAASALRGGGGWTRTALVGASASHRAGAAAAQALEDERAVRRRLEQELADARAEARHAASLARVGRIAGSAAHDLNNVLTAIVGYADLLEQELESTTTGRADLEELRRAATRGAAIVEEILSATRHGREANPLSGEIREAACAPRETGAIDLADAFARIASPLRRVAGSGIAVEFEIEPKLPRVVIDADRLERALMNLVANARHAIEARPNARGRIEIRAERSRSARREGVRLSVADDGCGMTRELAARIFEPFFTTRSDRGGTGLGLADVADFVREAGGALGVDSEPDRGTTLHFELPGARAPRATVARARASASPSASRSPGSPGPVARPASPPTA